MSRSATRARKRARTANNRRNSMAFLEHMRAAEVSATGAHSSLGLLAASNLLKTGETVSATFAAKPSPSELPHTPAERSPKPSDMPKRSIWQAATGDTAPVPIPEGARPSTEPTPVKIAELPDKVRELAKIAKSKGILSREWVSLGAVDRDGSDREVFARLHGNSIRYAIAA